MFFAVENFFCCREYFHSREFFYSREFFHSREFFYRREFFYSREFFKCKNFYYSQFFKFKTLTVHVPNISRYRNNGKPPEQRNTPGTTEILRGVFQRTRNYYSFSEKSLSKYLLFRRCSVVSAVSPLFR